MLDIYTVNDANLVQSKSLSVGYVQMRSQKCLYRCEISFHNTRMNPTIAIISRSKSVHKYSYCSGSSAEHVLAELLVDVL